MTNNTISGSTNRLASMLKHPSRNSGFFKSDSKVSTASPVKVSSGNIFGDKLNKTKAVSIDTEQLQSVKENTSLLHKASVKLFAASENDADDFAESVRNFAECYNNAIESLKTTDNISASAVGDNLSRITESYSVSLNNAGITVEKGKLSVDDEALKENIKYAGTLFRGKYSYGEKIAAKTSELNNIPALSSIGIYDRYGMFCNNQ